MAYFACRVISFTWITLAAAHEAELDFTMADIDALSRRVPNLCKVAPSTQKYEQSGRKSKVLVKALVK